jgi:hypothetical protein
MNLTNKGDLLAFALFGAGAALAVVAGRRWGWFVAAAGALILVVRHSDLIDGSRAVPPSSVS